MDFDLSKIDNFVNTNMIFDADKTQLASVIYNPINHLDSNENNMIKTDNLDSTILADDPQNIKINCYKEITKNATDFISSTFFPDELQTHIFRFQYLINNSFNKMTNDLITDINLFIKTKTSGSPLKYTDILFLYKGGTTLKIIYDTYVKKLRHTQNTEFFRLFNDNFKRSDSDYCIMINPNINIETNGISFAYVYKLVNKRVTDILYNISLFLYNDSISDQDILNKSLITDEKLQKFITNIEKSIESIKGKPENSVCTNYFNCDKIIKVGYNNRFSRAYTSHDEINEFYEENKPELMQKIDDDLDIDMKSSFVVYTDISGKKIIAKPKQISEDNPQELFDINTDINFSINDAINIKDTSLCLQRLKLKFVLYYIDNSNTLQHFACPGELIDVVILKQKSSSLHYFYHNLEKEYNKYTYTLQNKHIIYNSYSLYGNIFDLLYILFIVSDLPWNDAKYQNRINRLILLLIFELYDKNNNNEDLKKDLQNYIDLIIFLLVNNNLDNKDKIFQYLKKIYTEKNNINKKLLENLIKLYTNIDIKSESINLTSFLFMFYDKLKFFNTANIYNIDTLEQEIGKLDLLGTRVEQLGGNYKQKYLKYKQKYLKLKSKRY
jgi:hypothetical protein